MKILHLLLLSILAVGFTFWLIFKIDQQRNFPLRKYEYKGNFKTSTISANCKIVNAIQIETNKEFAIEYIYIFNSKQSSNKVICRRIFADNNLAKFEPLNLKEELFNNNSQILQLCNRHLPDSVNSVLTHLRNPIKNQYISLKYDDSNILLFVIVKRDNADNLSADVIVSYYDLEKKIDLQ